MAFIAFISLGLPDAILGVAFPSIRAEFDLPAAAIGVILFSSSVGYFLSSTFAGTIMRVLSLGWLLAISTGLVAVGLTGYSLAPFFPWFMLLAFGIGAGSGAVDTGLNAYAAERWTAARMNWLHGFFGIGAMIGPLVMTAVLTSGADWQIGYRLVGVVIVVMAVAFVLTRGLWADPASTPGDVPPAAVSLGHVLSHRAVLVQAAVFVTYCAVEVSAGQWAYTILRERFEASEGMAGVWVGLYWGALAAGRLLFGSFAERLGPARLVRWSLVATLAGTVAFLVPAYGVAVAGLLVTGLGLAAVFPTLITLTSRRLPAPFVTHAIGISIGAAVLGGASFPTIGGALEGVAGPTAIAVLIAVTAGGCLVLNELLDRMLGGGTLGRTGQAPAAAAVAD
jgi:fucose permease